MRHICSFCQKRPDEDAIGTTYDYNNCDYATDIMYADDEYLFQGDDNDREYIKNGKVVLKTEDNGGGYNIVKCKGFYCDYKKYIHSEEWIEKRNDRFFIDGYKCQFCGSATNLQVHHLTYENVPDEPMEDLLTLCKTCHTKLHSSDISRKRSFYLS